MNIPKDWEPFDEPITLRGFRFDDGRWCDVTDEAHNEDAKRYVVELHWVSDRHGSEGRTTITLRRLGMLGVPYPKSGESEDGFKAFKERLRPFLALAISSKLSKTVSQEHASIPLELTVELSSLP